MEKTKSVTHWVGIDVAKDSLEVFVGASRRFAVENTHDGISQLVKELGSLEGAHAIFEATGGYEAALAEAFVRAKLPFTRINPRLARCQFAGSWGHSCCRVMGPGKRSGRTDSEGASYRERERSIFRIAARPGGLQKGQRRGGVAKAGHQRRRARG